MDFAKKQMQKYGWEEGKGLGKNEDGIAKALKPKLKFDTAGIGHNLSTEFTDHWWERLYDKAADNVQVTSNSDNVEMKLKDKEAVETSSKSHSKGKYKNKGTQLEYGTFVKTEKLMPHGVVELNNPFRNLGMDDTLPKPRVLTDEELFAACGKRTAHKSARRGATLSAKLTRVANQERRLLKKMRQVSLSDETDSSPKKKQLERKLRKLSEFTKKTVVVEPIQPITNPPSTSSTQSSKKKEKKSKKKVSFNSTVIEYQKSDVDSSSHSVDSDGSRCTTPTATVVRKVNIKTEQASRRGVIVDNTPADADEGIEMDLEEKVGSELEAKRKKENKIMRKKLRELRRKSGTLKTKTSEFLDYSLGPEDGSFKRKGDSSHHSESFKKKRKLIMNFKIDEVANTLAATCSISKQA